MARGDGACVLVCIVGGAGSVPDARAYVSTDHVVDHMVRVALDINDWHLTMSILALLRYEGGPGQGIDGLLGCWPLEGGVVSVAS